MYTSIVVREDCANSAMCVYIYRSERGLCAQHTHLLHLGKKAAESQP